MSIQSQIETILFVAGKPLGVKKISKVLQISEEEALMALKALAEKYNIPESGITVMQNNEDWQMASNPENKTAAENFLKAEVSGELTRPQLETLTVVSYCGPITRPELDQIRGVNCSLILRNLMMRGLVKENDDNTSLLPKYEVTMEYLRHLGLNSITELPDYEKLHQHQHITSVLSQSDQTQA